jgi:ribonucleoside-diphosphate reductase alpha chain
MDCDTTGIEPEFGLVKFKKLAGGGYFKIINQSVVHSLRNLGYNDEQIKDIVRYMSGANTLKGAPYVNATSLRDKGFRDEDLEKVEKHLPTVFDITSAFNVWTLGEDAMKHVGIPPDKYKSYDFNLLRHIGFSDKQIEDAGSYICGTMTIEGAPHLKEEHYPIFDCANKCGKKGKRFLQHMAHIKIMAAAQPFLSGSISKTINMPNEATVDDIKETYLESWKLGLKSIAIYRDGSKLSQPLAAKLMQAKKAEEHKPQRRRMPVERRAITHKFQIANQEGYITVGLYEEGTPGEIFITMNKEGSIVSGLMDSFATSISIALQYGVPLKVLASKFIHTRFEPSGVTNNPEIRMAKSISDYIFKWLSYKFLTEQDLEALGVKKLENGNGHSTLAPEPPAAKQQPDQMTLSIFEFDKKKKETQELNSDAPACHVCGGLMVRSGTCYVCLNCGATSGCS